MMCHFLRHSNLLKLLAMLLPEGSYPVEESQLHIWHWWQKRIWLTNSNSILLSFWQCWATLMVAMANWFCSEDLIHLSQTATGRIFPLGESICSVGHRMSSTKAKTSGYVLKGVSERVGMPSRIAICRRMWWLNMILVGGFNPCEKY